MSETDDSSGDRPEPAPAPPPSQAAGPGTSKPRLRDRLDRTRAGLAGAAALLLLGGGVGGYFVGHATGDDDHGRDFPGVRGPGGFHHGGPAPFQRGGGPG